MKSIDRFIVVKSIDKMNEIVLFKMTIMKYTTDLFFVIIVKRKSIES